MNRKNFCLFVAVATLLAVGGQALARHVTHPVTPENIDKQPYGFTVKVKDAGELKEVEIKVKREAGKSGPGIAARGEFGIVPIGKETVPAPPLTMVTANGEVTFTFQIALKYLDRTSFTYTEASDDPFPVHGDYYVFEVKDFVGKPGK